MTRRSSSNKKMSLVVVIALLMSLVAFIDSPLRANAQVSAPDAPSVPVVEFTAGNGNLGYSFTAPNGTNDNGSAITQFNVRTYTGSPRQLVNGATCSIPSSAAIKKCAIVNDATNTYFQQGNNYEFSLSATNANGTSAETFVDEITFSATAPSSPTNLQATVTNDTATVSIQPPSATPNSSLNGGVALKSYRVDAYPANPRTSQSVGSCLIAASQQTVNGVVEETAGSCAINNLPIGSYVFSATATSKSLQVSAPSSDSNEVFVVGVSSSSTTVPTQAQQGGAVGASSTVPDAPPAPSVVAHREVLDIRNLTTNGFLVTVAPPSSTPNAAANGGVPLVRYDVSAVKVSDRSVVGSCSIDAHRESFGGVISEVGGTCRILVAVTEDLVVTVKAVNAVGSSVSSTDSSTIASANTSTEFDFFDSPNVWVENDASNTPKLKAQLRSSGSLNLNLTQITFNTYSGSPRASVSGLTKSFITDQNRASFDDANGVFELGTATVGTTYEVAAVHNYLTRGNSSEYFGRKITASDTKPTAPSAPTVSHSNGVVTATVAPPSTTPSSTTNGKTALNHYTVQAYDNSVSPATAVWGKTCEVLASQSGGAEVGGSCTISGLNAGSYVFAATVTGDSYLTSSESTKTSALSVAGRATAPAAPTATHSHGVATISVTPPSTTPNATANGGVALTGYTVRAYDSADALVVGKTCRVTARQLAGIEVGGSCTISGLPQGANKFTVTADNSFGSSAESAKSSAVTVTSAPTAPAAPTATVSGSTATITVTPPSTTPNASANGGEALTSYTVRAYNATTNAVVAGKTCQVTASQSGGAEVGGSCSISNMPGGPHKFTVTATNAAGTSPESALSTSLTIPDPPTAPAAPTATVSGTTATITVAPPSTTLNAAANGSTALTSYTVRAYNATTNAVVAGKTCQVTASQSGGAEVGGSCSISNMPGGPHKFTVTATNSVGTSPESVLSASLLIPGPPSAPSAPVAAASGATVFVTVVPPSTTPNDAANGGAALTRYTVRAYNATTNAVVAGKTCQVTATQASGAEVGGSCSLEIFVSGQYKFTATAENAFGSSAESLKSSAVTVTVNAPDAPPAPSVLVLRNSSDPNSLSTEGFVVSVAPPSSTLNGSANGGVPIVRYDVSVLKVSDRSVFNTCSIDAHRESFGGVIFEAGGSCSFSYSGSSDLIATVKAVNAVGSSVSSADSSTVSSTTSSKTTVHFKAPSVSVVKDASNNIKLKASVPGADSTTFWDMNFKTYTGSPRTENSALSKSFRINDSVNGPSGVDPAGPHDLGTATQGTTYEVSGSYDVSRLGFSPEFFSKKITASDTAPSAPSAPRNFRKLSESDGRVLLAWDAPTTDNGSSITGYEVSSGAGNPRCLTVGVGATSCRVSGLSNGTTFTFTVKARNGALGTNSAGEVGLSESAAAVTASPGRVPKAPSNITATNARDGILVQWDQLSSSGNDPGNGGRRVTKYIVSAVQNSAVTCEAVPNPARPTDPAARGCKVIGAQLGISYSFKVFAINEFGDGDIAYSTARGAAFGMPSAPSNMRAVEGNPTVGRDFDVKWDPPTTLNASTIASYEVRQTFTFRNLNVNFHLNNQVSSTVICTVGAIQPRSCSAFMTNGNPISFDITQTVSTPSLDADGNLVTGTTNGPTGTFTFVPSGLPFAPASLSATAGDQSIVATWNEAGFRKIFGDWINTPGDGGSPITSYRVVAKNAANGAVESQCVVTSPVATGNRCTLMNLRNGTTYNISVVAVNVKGSSTEAVFNGVTPTK